MASVPSPPRHAAAPTTLPHSAGWDGPWPHGAVARWTVRLALAVPYLIVAVVTAQPGLGTANAALIGQARLIRWGESGWSAIRDLYPPAPTAIAALPSNAGTTLACLGALCAGMVLGVAAERLRRLDQPWWTTVPVLLSLGATPLYWLTATRDLAGFAGLALLASAITGVLRFTINGETQGGFRAGLALGAAAAFDLAALGYTAVLGLLASGVARLRHRDVPHMRRAVVLVVLFPTVASIAGWLFLEWRFTGSVRYTGGPQTSFFTFPHGVPAAALDALRTTLAAVGVTPVLPVAVAVLIRTRPGWAALLTLPIAGLALSAFVGLWTAQGRDQIILALVAAMALPARPTRRLAAAFTVAALCQLALAGAAPLSAAA